MPSGKVEEEEEASSFTLSGECARNTIPEIISIILFLFFYRRGPLVQCQW